MIKKQCRNWSHKTMLRALQIKFVCGHNDYDALIQQRYPLLINLWTLQRKLEDLKFEPGISDQMFQFLLYKKSHFENEANSKYSLILK